MSYQAHETAVIDTGCHIGDGTRVWHFSHIMAGCRIGKACNIGQNVYVAPGAEVLDSIVMPGAVIEEGAKVQYAIVAENAVVGKTRAHSNRSARAAADVVSSCHCA